MNPELIKVMIGAGLGLLASTFTVVYDYSRGGLLLDRQGYPSLVKTFMRDLTIMAGTTLGLAAFGAAL